MYQAVLFDLDGTLIDSGEGITASVKYALQKMKIEDYDQSVLYKFIGPALNQSFAVYFGMDEKQANRAVEFYRENYSARGMYQNTIYPRMEETLKKLYEKGITLMVATAKPHFFAEKILKHMELEQYFAAIEGNGLRHIKTSKEEMIKACLNRLQENEKAVMVGDTHFDITAANHLGIDSVAVTYGYGDMEELKKANPTYFINSPEALLDLL